MKMFSYQNQATQFRLESASSLEYLALGLCGESGEVAEHIKKFIRDGKLDKAAVTKELGDVLWYIANLCDLLDTSLEEIASSNLGKLSSRAARGKIQGSGDDR